MSGRVSASPKMQIVELAGGEDGVIRPKCQKVLVAGQQVVSATDQVGRQNHVVTSVTRHPGHAPADVDNFGNVLKLSQIALELSVRQWESRPNAWVVQREAKFLKQRLTED